MKKIFIVFMMACLLCGCGKETAVPEQIEATEAVVVVETSETTVPEVEFTFVDISAVDFVYSSGAGAWNSTVLVSADGTFTGSYHDTDMGDTGEDYPGGTYYWCEFMGKLGQPVKVNSYTYEVEIEKLVCTAEPETVEIRQGVRRVASEPYGFYSAQKLQIFLPGAPLEELPEGYLSWIQGQIKPEQEALLFYGLYNPQEEAGFSSYEMERLDWEVRISMLEQQDGEKRNILNSNPDLRQEDQVLYAGAIYWLWENALDRLWAWLQVVMDDGAMEVLVTQQQAWLAEREAAAGAPDQSDGWTPEAYMTAADMTKARFYVLLEMINPA